MQQPTAAQADNGQESHRHVVFAADVAAGNDRLSGTRTPAHPGVARAESAELPISCFTAADSNFCTAESEGAASVLRSRPSALGDAGGLMTGDIEVANPLSRHPSGIPVLRRSGTSLAHDGSAFAAIDMPQLLSRQGSLLSGATNDVDDSSAASSRSSHGAPGGGGHPTIEPPAAGVPCFGRMRPSVALALSALCLIAAVSIFSAWLPDSFHTAAHNAVQKAMQQQQSIFEPRQDVVIVFKQAGFTVNSRQNSALTQWLLLSPIQCQAHPVEHLNSRAAAAGCRTLRSWRTCTWCAGGRTQGLMGPSGATRCRPHATWPRPAPMCSALSCTASPAASPGANNSSHIASTAQQCCLATICSLLCAPPSSPCCCPAWRCQN